MATQYPIDMTVMYWNALAYYVETSGVNTIEYFGTPRQPWLLLTESWWKWMKMITVTATTNLAAGKSITWAGWSPDYAFVATDLNTVKAFSYS